MVEFLLTTHGGWHILVRSRQGITNNSTIEILLVQTAIVNSQAALFPHVNVVGHTLLNFLRNLDGVLLTSLVVCACAV